MSRDKFIVGSLKAIISLFVFILFLIPIIAIPASTPTMGPNLFCSIGLVVAEFLLGITGLFVIICISCYELED